jgi:hypothetical protein
MEKKTVLNDIADFIASTWDDVLVYLASVVGSICALWYVADKAGAKFTIKLGYVIIAAFLAILGMALLEYARHAAAEKKGSLAAHIMGKRSRVLPRIGVSWAIGFVVQLAFPGVIENLVNFLVGLSNFGSVQG